MRLIVITRPHSKSLKEAKKAVNRLAETITKKFSVEYKWNEHRLHFSTVTGVEGHIEVSKASVQVHVRLGLLLLAIQQPIESEIERILDEEFS